MSAIATSNHFELFDLPVRYAVDSALLETAYRRVQSQVHPDRHAHASDAEKRVAMQWASRANEAYRTLRSPLKRAAYLCELYGVPLQAESNTAMAPAFLMQQMEWREALDAAGEARDEARLDRLEAEVRETAAALQGRVARALDDDADYASAAGLVRQWMFLDKFAQELDAVREAWHAD